MSRHAMRALLVLACAASGAASAQTAAEPAIDPSSPVTVVVAVQLEAGSEPAAALVALNDMRALMRRQPGFLSESLLQNLNPGNSPRYVHVSRWATLTYWSALFRAPEFARLGAHGNEHYTITASAFVPAE